MTAPITDDGLIAPEIGPWGEQKYGLLQGYARVFATSMKRKWGARVYVDLFAGSGRSTIRDTNRVLLASPLLALEIPDRFDRYIFCEKDPQKITALEKRVRRDYRNVDIRFISGDANEEVRKIAGEIREYGKIKKRFLTFCFADPWKLENLRFSTIEQLAELYVDFLILIPTGMDAARNVEHVYIRPDNKTLDEFVGTPKWREAWRNAESRKETFDSFLTNFYATRMEQLGYREHAAEQTQLIRSTEKNLPLYRLAFFSRHELGQQFWKEVKKYVNPQLDLWR
ncbi:MAG TPA: three-Cys-motif partner protein TcmP [Candidatus Binatia bacterium]|jgi:three-Cys-motif partner protein